MKEAKEFDAFLGGAVVDAVFCNGIAAAVEGEFGAWAAEGVPSGELVKFGSKSENQLICVKKTVFGHIVPNVAKVRNRRWRIDYRWHGLGVVV
jgi:hypothetical protein